MYALLTVSATFMLIPICLVIQFLLRSRPYLGPRSRCKMPTSQRPVRSVVLLCAAVAAVCWSWSRGSAGLALLLSQGTPHRSALRGLSGRLGKMTMQPGQIFSGVVSCPGVLCSLHLHRQCAAAPTAHGAGGRGRVRHAGLARRPGLGLLTRFASLPPCFVLGGLVSHCQLVAQSCLLGLLIAMQ